MSTNHGITAKDSFVKAWMRLLLILAIGLFIFNFISLFIPFAQYPKFIKELIFAGCLIIWFSLYRLLWQKISTQFNRNSSLYKGELKRHWGWHFFLAVAFTFVVASLTRVHSPVLPVKLDFENLAFNQSGLSVLYRAWIFFYPITRVLLLFLYFFSSSIFIRTRTASPRDLPVQYGLLLILSYLFYIILNYQNELINVMSYNLLILGFSIVVFVLIPIGIDSFTRKFPDAQVWVFISIILAASVLQIIYIGSVPNAQVSDFLDFNNLALKLARGEPNVSINIYATFTRLLSLFYRIHPSADTAKVVNILLNALSMLGLFWIGKECGCSRAGILAAYLFGMLPSQSGMAAIVNNDIPSITFLILCVVFLMSYLKTAKWYKLVISAFFFGMALFIRFTMLIYSPILILPLFLQNRRSWKQLAVFAVTLVLGLFTCIFTLNAVIASVRVDNSAVNDSRNIISPLLKGTNMAFEGRVNYQDGDLVDSWPAQEIWKRGIPVVLDRVFSDPIAYFKFLKVKYSYLLGDTTYVADYVFNFENRDLAIIESTWLFPVEIIHNWFAQFSQFSFWCVSAAAVLFIFLYEPALKNISWIGLTIFLCALCSYSLFEVQPRYNRPLIPFLVLFAALFFTLRKTDS
jgi:hypothetical protein